MHDNVSRPAEPGPQAGEHVTDKSGEALFAARKFPGAAPEALTPVPRPLAPVKRSSFQRAVLPVILFIGAIAAIAWVTQFMPNWREPSKHNPGLATSGKPALVFYQAAPVKSSEEIVNLIPVKDPFPMLGSLWDPSNPNYIQEFELEDEGAYDFLFANESDQAALLGLEYQSCTCSKIKICVLSADAAREHIRKRHKRGVWNESPPAAEEPNYGWTELSADNKVTVTVPAGQGGIIRLTWEGNKVKEKSDLSFNMWFRPDGGNYENRIAKFFARVALTQPVQCFPKNLQFGDIQPGGSPEREFWCWTGTRPKFDITFPDNAANPCIQCRADALTPEECLELQNRVAEDRINTKVRAGYRVTVTVAEKKGDSQLDMGLLYRQIAMTALLDGRTETVPAPYIRAVIPSDVRIGNKKTFALDLETFSAKTGALNRKFTLFTDKETKLEMPKGKIAEPETLSYTLKEKGPVGSETAWELTLSAPGNNLLSGPLEHSYIVLISTRPGGPPREVRIPVTGTAQRSGGGF